MITRLSILGFLLISTFAAAQPGGNPYDSYTPGSYNNYVRERNNAARDERELERQHYKPSKISSTSLGSGTVTTNNNWANTSYHDWQVKVGEKLARENKERMNDYEAEVKKFKALISDKGHARAEADHFDLLLTGMRAGIGYRAMQFVIGENITDYEKINGTTGLPFHRYDPGADQANMYLTAALTEKNPLTRAGFYEEAIKRFPTAELTLNRADALREALAYNKAIEAYKQTDLIEGNRFGVLFGWATVCAMQGDAKEAESLYLRTLAISPQAPVDMNLAWVRFVQGKIGAAMQSLDSAMLKDADNAGVWLAAAALTTDATIHTKALAKALALEPALASGNMPQKLFNHAKAMQKDGAYELSIFFLDLAVAREPKNIDFLELRYGSNKKLGRNKQADEDEQTMSKL